MNNRINQLVAGVALSIAAMSASASGLLVTSTAGMGKAAGSRYASFDINSDGDVRGFEFKIDMSKTQAKGAGEQSKIKGVDLSGCVSELPKNFLSKCDVMDKGDILVFVFSADGTVLPKGVHSVGKIAIPGLSGKPKIYDLNIVDTNGKSLKSDIQESE